MLGIDWRQPALYLCEAPTHRPTSTSPEWEWSKKRRSRPLSNRRTTTTYVVQQQTLSRFHILLASYNSQPSEKSILPGLSNSAEPVICLLAYVKLALSLVSMSIVVAFFSLMKYSVVSHLTKVKAAGSCRTAVSPQYAVLFSGPVVAGGFSCHIGSLSFLCNCRVQNIAARSHIPSPQSVEQERISDPLTLL